MKNIHLHIVVWNNKIPTTKFKMDSVLKYNLAHDIYMTLPVYHKKESVDDYE